MNNKEVIIEKIINDAKAVADENISKAKEEVALIEKKTNDQISAFRDNAIPKGKARVEEVYKRKEMVTNLDSKKIVLSKKKEAIDSVFNTVANYMRKNEKDKYISLVKKMIELNADDGDKVLIGEKDKSILTAKVIADLSKAIGKKLTLSESFGDFDGGVILIGQKYDKNLTFEQEFELIKEENEAELAKILFGE